MKRKFLAVLGVSLLPLYAMAAEPPHSPLQQACAMGAAPWVSLPGVTLRALPAQAPGDLPYVEANSARTGATARIFHEPALAAAAQSKAACLVGMIDLLAPLVPDTRRNLLWSSMVITRDPHYAPLVKTEEGRWLNIFTSTDWDQKSMDYLLVVMPHEEVHHSQRQSKHPLPRWFGEGHANWASLKVLEQLRPDLARREREQLAAERAKFDALHLRAWGGLMVKKEAIDRQLSPEERALRDKDPSLLKARPMRFEPEDMVQDESNLQARYGAALALFDGLEQRHGRAAVQRWISAVFEAGDAKKEAVPLAQQILGEDIAPLLL